MSDTLQQLKDYIKTTNYYNHVSNLLYWDTDTIMPEKGFEANVEASTFFGTEAFKRSTSAELKDMIDTLSRPEEYEKLDDDWQFIVGRMKREFDENSRVPVDFYSEMIKAQSESEHAWEKAKNASDFNIFAPHLKKMIEMSAKLREYKKPGKDVYNSMIDDFEEGMDTDTIDRIFDELKKELIPLVKAIKAKGVTVNPKFERSYDLDAQRRLQDILLNYIGFDRNQGAVGETEHPFTIGISRFDVRVSNHFREDNAIDPMFSAIHEGGHAIFMQNVNPALAGTVGDDCCYMGVHESQSRFFENILGRRKAFWEPVYDEVIKTLPEFADVSLDEFYHEINRVEPGMIRTMADEVTYCLHIIIRYEIEKKIFREGVRVEELPELWNSKMKEYLGIVPQNDAEGILQDMHWSDGSFGYFPSYLLGSVYDGMFLDAIEEDMGSVDDILREGRILDITHWLNEKIHKYGSTRLPAEVIEKVCRKPLSAEPLIRYFKNKYKEIYDL